MKRKLTITVSNDIYNALQEVVGPGNISQFLEDLARPHVLRANLAEGYQMAAADEEQEEEALEWSNALMGDINE